MSVGPDSQVDINVLEQTRKHINRLVEEIARLSDRDLPPVEYYSEFLQRVQTALAATAGAVWLLTPQGNLQLQYQINMRQVGLDRNEAARQSHDELLRQVIVKSQPMLMLPHSGLDPNDAGNKAANLSDYVVLLAPFIVERQVVGVLEIWQDPNRNPHAQRGFLQFMVHVADLASGYIRNSRLRQMSGQQQVWAQLEAFTKQIHGSLHPTEVSYLVANEGKRLIGCDRLSVAQRHGKRSHVEAISGADVVEKRSNLVQLMRALFDAVLTWDEKLVYTGTPDETLPPAVLSALNEYLAESNSKLLVIQPVRDEREKDNKKPCRSALMMESFEPAASPEQLTAKLDVIGKHSVSALYNAAEYRRIPMRYLWMPIAKVQEGLGGKARAIIYGSLAALALVSLAMVLVPYPLKMDSKGQLLPESRTWIFPPVQGHVVRFEVAPGSDVLKDQSLVLMHDVELELKLINLNKEIDAAEREIASAKARYSEAGNEGDRSNLLAEQRKQESVRDLKIQERNRLRDRTNSEESRPGNFWLKSPMDGTVLNTDFVENLTGKFVKASDQLLRVGDKSGLWEIELKVPQKHIGQILQAFDFTKQKELDVDLLLLTQPTRIFKGKVTRDKIAGQATPDRTDNDESEPVVLVRVRVEGDDIPERERLPRDLLLTGTEVHAKVRCGNHAMGYSLFYGVWEFLYEKVVFFF